VKIGGFHWLQTLVLINPLVYVNEGMRAAFTNAPHMHLYVVYPVMIAFGAFFSPSDCATSVDGYFPRNPLAPRPSELERMGRTGYRDFVMVLSDRSIKEAIAQGRISLIPWARTACSPRRSTSTSTSSSGSFETTRSVSSTCATPKRTSRS